MMDTTRTVWRQSGAGKPALALAALITFALSCTPLSTPVLTEEPGASPTPTEFRPEITSSPVPEVRKVATETPVIPAPTGSPKVPVSLVMAGNAFSRSSLNLLGGFRDGEWLAAEQAADFLDIDGEYRTYVLDGLEQITSIAAIQRVDELVEHCNQPEYTIQMEAEVLPFTIGLNSGWPANPRPVEWLSNQNQTYLQALEAYLLSAGLDSPQVEIQQILRVDLDGDGTDEVLIAASRFVEPTGHSVEPGDYSVVLMRKISGGQVITQRLLGEVYPFEEPLAFPPSYSLQGILDVNADGRMEVLVYRQVWEGHGTVLFELHEDRLEEVLRLVCGL